MVLKVFLTFCSPVAVWQNVPHTEHRARPLNSPVPPSHKERPASRLLLVPSTPDVAALPCLETPPPAAIDLLTCVPHLWPRMRTGRIPSNLVYSGPHSGTGCSVRARSGSGAPTAHSRPIAARRGVRRRGVARRGPAAACPPGDASAPRRQCGADRRSDGARRRPSARPGRRRRRGRWCRW